MPQFNEALHPRDHGRFTEKDQADPGTSVLSGVPAPVIEHVMAEALAGIKGGDVGTFAGVLTSLIEANSHSNIQVGQTGTEVILQVSKDDVRGTHSRYDLYSANIPDGGTGADALRAYTEEAQRLLAEVAPVAAAMTVTSPAPVDPASDTELRMGDFDADGNPGVLFWQGDSFRLAAEPEDAPGDAYGFLIRTSEPMTDEQMGRLSQLAGYAWAATVHGESLPAPDRVDDRTMYLFADSTKGRGTLYDFTDQLPVFIADGSPVRKSNRAGAGTQGTRLVEGLPGLGGFGLYFEE